MIRIRLLPIPLVLAITGCGSLPEGKVKYFLAKTEVAVKVTRTVACDPQGRLLVDTTTTRTVLHFADRRKAYAFDLAPFASALKDADLKFELYEDGRVKGLNAASTGQGEAILRTAVGLAALAIPASQTQPVAPQPANPLAEACKFIKDSGDKGTLTLTYSGTVSLDSLSVPIPILPEPSSLVPDRKLNDVLGAVTAMAQSTAAADNEQRLPFAFSAGRFEGEMLQAREPATVLLSVIAQCRACGRDYLWTGDVPAAQHGTPYRIPVPASGIFGKLTTVLTFAESGSLTSVQYANATGTGQALNVINAGATAVQGSAAAEAALLKAQADLIFQQQRLLQCQADPGNCK